MATPAPRNYSTLAKAGEFDTWSAGWSWSWKTKSRSNSFVKQLPAAQHQKHETTKDAEDGQQLISLPPPFINSPSSAILTTDFFEVKYTQDRGFAAFATRDIEYGTTILIESALLEATDGDILREFERLKPEEKNEYLKLSSFDELHKNKVAAIFMTNRFLTSNGRCGIFLIASRFNHACRPNQTCSSAKAQKSQYLIPILENTYTGTTDFSAPVRPVHRSKKLLELTPVCFLIVAGRTVPAGEFEFVMTSQNTVDTVSEVSYLVFFLSFLSSIILLREWLGLYEI
ncbi:hypothetical protein B7463_g5447, partial [Scytalidium lignicola]